MILTRPTVAALAVRALADLPENQRAEVLLVVTMSQALDLLDAHTDWAHPQTDDPAPEDVEVIWQRMGPAGQARFRAGLLQEAA